MRIIPAGLVSQYTGGGSTLAYCLRMTLRDSTVIGASSIDRDLVIDGLTYKPWMDVSDLVSTSSLAVDNLSMTINTDDPDLMVDIEAGRYDNADFYIFEVNYLSPTDGQNPVKRGTTGEATVGDLGTYTLEFRGLSQALQQTVGLVTNRTCRANFADFPFQRLSSRCGLNPDDWTVEGTVTSTDAAPPNASPDSGSVTSVINGSAFSDSAVTKPSGYYTGGLLLFTTGLNMGRSRIVSSDANGLFTLALPFPDAPVVGDDFQVSQADYSPPSPAYTFTDTARTEADDWFGDGVVTMTGGLNAGYARQVATFASGAFVLRLPFPFAVQVGDGYSAIAGCRKRHERTSLLPAGVSDCIDKFNNILNFQAEPHLPGIDALTKIPGVGG